VEAVKGAAPGASLRNSGAATLHPQTLEDLRHDVEIIADLKQNGVIGHAFSPGDGIDGGGEGAMPTLDEVHGELKGNAQYLIKNVDPSSVNMLHTQAGADLTQALILVFEAFSRMAGLEAGKEAQISRFLELLRGLSKDILALRDKKTTFDILSGFDVLVAERSGRRPNIRPLGEEYGFAHLAVSVALAGIFVLSVVSHAITISTPWGLGALIGAALGGVLGFLLAMPQNEGPTQPGMYKILRPTRFPHPPAVPDKYTLIYGAVGAVLLGIVGGGVGYLASHLLAWVSAAGALGTVSLAGAALLGWPAPNIRVPSWSERRKIQDANDLAGESPLAKALNDEYYIAGGSYWVDTQLGAAYHVRAFLGPEPRHRPNIVLTEDTLRNGSLHFLQAVIARAQTFSAKFFAWDDPKTPWREDLPDSLEKLAAAYIYMALSFAEMSGYRSYNWNEGPDTLDHRHMGKDLYIWAFYITLRQVLRLPFTETQFFKYLRDFTAKEVERGGAYALTLWERAYKPEVPQELRIDEKTYRAAVEKIYGKDGNGDFDSQSQSYSGKNVLGMVINWFRGNDPARADEPRTP